MNVEVEADVEMMRRLRRDSGVMVVLCRGCIVGMDEGARGVGLLLQCDV